MPHVCTGKTHKKEKFIRDRMVGGGLIEEFKIKLGLKRCDWAKIRMAKDIVAGGPS